MATVASVMCAWFAFWLWARKHQMRLVETDEKRVQSLAPGAAGAAIRYRKGDTHQIGRAKVILIVLAAVVAVAAVYIFVLQAVQPVVQAVPTPRPAACPGAEGWRMPGGQRLPC
jgi:peptidoglycan/LPS O-acetylase OafA/YrhL